MSAGWPEEPFWDFSLVFYERSGVEEALLRLQGARGLDVNLVLLCCWLGGQGRCLGAEAIADLQAAVARWRGRVILPLRRARRALGEAGLAPADLAEQVQGLRRAVQASELDAEHAEQILLARRAAGLAAPAGAGPTCTATSLAHLGPFDGDDAPGLRLLLQEAHPGAGAREIGQALRRLAGEA